MTREQFWSLLLAGKVSGEELHEAFESMSEEDQQKVRERIDEMVEGIARVFEGIKQGLGRLAEDLHKWWASVPEEVKKGLVEYGESNVSKLDE